MLKLKKLGIRKTFADNKLLKNLDNSKQIPAHFIRRINLNFSRHLSRKNFREIVVATNSKELN
ncbi:hypothetical protein HYS72_01090 [Candidatus Pacearchaeota archaeon]|nr:hypothetical protein [Candidatus Pacearchaeota archaeon]